MMEELIQALVDLLADAEYLYQYYPNNFRKTVDEYFKEYHDILNKYRGA
jgi:hypothetical protein